MNIEELASERALSDSDYKSIILQPTQDEFNNIHKDIKAFPHLVSLDYAPDKFMQLISDLFDYKFLETEDSTVQREILKRIIQEYHNKGILEALQKICNRGHSLNFFLGDLTYYNEKINEGYSYISYPRDSLFRYDYSKWDGSDRWPDLIEWRDGVISIYLSNPGEKDYRVIDLIDEWLVAGVKFYITIIKDLWDKGYLDMIYRLMDDTIDHEVYSDLYVPPYYILNKYFRYDYSIWNEERWQSKYEFDIDMWVEKKPQAAIFRVFYPDDFGYYVAEVWREPFIWNWNRFCGIIGGYNEEYNDDIEIDIDIVSPYISKYHPFTVDNSKWDDEKWVMNYKSDIDMWIEKKPQAAIFNVYYPFDIGYSVSEVWNEEFIRNWNRYCGIIGE